MDDPPAATYREITCEHIVLREPRGGRARAVVETVPPGDDDPRTRGVRLVLLDGLGESAITAEVNHEGEPMLTIGPKDSGTTVVITPSTIDLWGGGNTVVSVTAAGDGGRVEVVDGEEAAT